MGAQCDCTLHNHNHNGWVQQGIVTTLPEETDAAAELQQATVTELQHDIVTEPVATELQQDNVTEVPEEDAEAWKDGRRGSIG